MALIYPESLNRNGIVAFFTDREGPLRPDPIGFKYLYMPVQRHTDRVKVIKGPEELKVQTLSDAVITALKGVLIGIKTADCVPVLVASKDGTVVGAVHAGWRGTAMGILKKTISTLKNRFSVSPDDILLAIGPSIRGCCYEVGPEVSEALRTASSGSDFIIKKQRGIFVDLAVANKRQAIDEGVPEENIWLSDDCTCCLPDRYHSYRRSKTSKRQGAFIGIKNPLEDI